MERLLLALAELGARRDRLEVRLFGGGRILANMSDAGNRNVAFVTEYIRVANLRIAGQDVGDIYPRRVLYVPDSGRVQVKRLRAVDGAMIANREAHYRASLGRSAAAPDGDPSAR